MAVPGGAPSSGWIDDVSRAARGIRLRVLEHTLANDGGYMSQACSAAEILSTLYLKVMRLGPSIAPLVPSPFSAVPGKGRGRSLSGAGYNGPGKADDDRFFLSPAHYALVLYATLVETGRMAPEGLAQFNKDGSTVEMIGAEHSPGFEMMGGALAQTLSQAAGIALAKKLKRERGRVVVFLSDGEFQEGQTWEAIQTMSFYKLDNMIVCVDVNGQQCDGEMKDVMGIEPLDARIESFGAHASVVDGHDPFAIDAACGRKPDGRPTFVLCRTDPCRGLGILDARRPKFHYLRFASSGERKEYAKFYEAEMKRRAEKE